MKRPTDDYSILKSSLTKGNLICPSLKVLVFMDDYKSNGRLKKKGLTRAQKFCFCIYKASVQFTAKSVDIYSRMKF